MTERGARRRFGQRLRESEEILLLLGDEDGAILPTRQHAFECALAGAVLRDLAFANRIDTDLEALVVANQDPTGNRMLDADEPTKGLPMRDVWEISIIAGSAKERTGYPTQKPLALLERIIAASCSEGDMILDPFCGCATTLVAADRLRRNWAGIDISPLAIKLVNDRIAEDRGLWGGAIALDSPPVRTDLGELPNYRTHRHRLYGEQEGICFGCDTHFPFRVMDADHILPRSKGGTDHADNLQLLCSGCNRIARRAVARWPNGGPRNDHR